MSQFNQVACMDELHCVAVGESEADSKTPGTRIWVTQDGGKSWQNTYTSPDPHASLLAAAAVMGGKYCPLSRESSATV